MESAGVAREGGGGDRRGDLGRLWFMDILGFRVWGGVATCDSKGEDATA